MLIKQAVNRKKSGFAGSSSQVEYETPKDF